MASDRGSGTVAVLAVVAAAIIALAAVAPGIAAVVARHEAASAADLAAVAGADALRGLIDGVPCEVAAGVAGGNGAMVERCGADGDTLTVTVSVPGPLGPVTASATAGPPR